MPPDETSPSELGFDVCLVFLDGLLVLAKKISWNWENGGSHVRASILVGLDPSLDTQCLDVHMCDMSRLPAARRISDKQLRYGGMAV